MIIRKKNITNKKTSSSNVAKSAQSRNVIKKEDVILGADDIQNTNESKNISSYEKKENNVEELETFEKIDISSIEFKERVERRRGDRRRGYRRIDERSLVSRAQQEAYTIKELAAREGYKNGFSQAQMQLEELKNNLVQFLGMKDEMYDKFYPHVMEIAFAIAKRIIKKETEMSDDVLKNIFEEVLDQLNSDAQRLEVKVHPDDVEFANVSLPEIVSEKNLNVRTIIVQDETIDKGSCVVIANNGVVDANFKTQLAVLQNAFGIYKGGL